MSSSRWHSTDSPPMGRSISMDGVPPPPQGTGSPGCAFLHRAQNRATASLLHSLDDFVAAGVRGFELDLLHLASGRIVVGHPIVPERLYPVSPEDLSDWAVQRDVRILLDLKVAGRWDADDPSVARFVGRLDVAHFLLASYEIPPTVRLGLRFSLPVCGIASELRGPPGLTWILPSGVAMTVDIARRGEGVIVSGVQDSEELVSLLSHGFRRFLTDDVLAASACPGLLEAFDR